MRARCRSVRIHPGGLFQTVATILGFIGVFVLLGGLRLLVQVPSVFLIGALLVSPWLLRWRSSRPRSYASVEVSPGRLVVDVRNTERAVPIERIHGAWERGPRSLVLVLDDRTEIDLVFEDALAATVLDELGYDVSKRTVRAMLRGDLGAFTQGFVTFIASMFVFSALVPHSLGLAGLLVATVSSGVTTALIVRRFGSPRVVIGADGLRLEGGLRKRFVPYSQIAAVRADAARVLVQLASRDALELPTVAQEAAQIDALVARIETGRAKYRAHAATGLHVLERAGRTFERWREHLASLSATGAGFREQALSTETLERALEDASAPVERRVGAAIVLKSMDPETQRIRVAAETCADERVRGALEAVCDDELDEAVLVRASRRA